eukprot:TRINITY_DN6852_c0_g1_i1.p1 TRINITY_DN6852_c0_g1~~TRINITY_DN6852_c0_g1_i1.p1  ORF type:complete len:547 (-),score=60.81 TRINITY_DN6852_c0_g1_i1:236-1816(-)
MSFLSIAEPPHYLMLTINGILILASMWLLTRSALLADVCSLARRFTQVVGFVRRNKDDKPDPFKQHVTEKLQLLQQERMQVACWMSLVIGTAALLISCLLIAGDVEPWISVRLNFFYCVSVVVFALIAKCCQFDSLWHVQATYGLMMMLTSLLLQLMDPLAKERRHDALLAVACFRILLCSTCINLQAVVFWNLICAVADSWKFVGMAHDHVSRSEDHIFVADAFMLLIITLLAGALLRESVRAAFHKDVCIKAYRIEHAASHFLLEHFCDAVLPVDADLQINGCADRFAATLMLDPNGCQEGTEVKKFIPLEEDWQRFRKQFCSPCARADPVPHVSCLNLHLRDGSGNHVRFEVIGVAFQNFNNDVNYKFGLREATVEQSFPIRDLRSHEPRSARRCSSRGTPPAIAAENLDDRVSTTTLSSRPSYHVTRLADPSFEETSLKGRVVSLYHLMATWNLDTSQRNCCTFHSYLPHVRTVVDDMSFGPCKDNLHSNPRIQCKECGVLDSFDATCTCLCCGCEVAPMAL